MRFTLCGRVLALAAGMALTAGATPASSLPISPDWVTITPQEAAGG